MDDDNQRRLAELQEQNAELRRQVADLQRSQHLLQAVVEGTTDAVFVKDLRGRYLMANSAALNFMGKAIEEVLGRDDTLLNSAEIARQIMERDRRTMESGQTQTDEEVGTAGGQTRTYLSTKGPYRDEQGRVIGLIGISRDVTERKRSEDLLRESEERHRIFAELTSDCVYIYRIQPDGRFLLEWMSESFSRIMGYTVEEFRALNSPLDAIHPDDRATSAVTQKRILAGEPTVIERRVITKQGETRWLRAYSRPQWDADGRRVVALYGASQDITERKRAEMALRASEANYRMLVEQASDGIFIADRQGKFTEVNSRGCQLLGYAKEELLELAIPNVHPLEEAARFGANMSGLLAGETIRDELQFKRKDGSCFPGELSGRLLPDGRFQGIVRDVTERKRAEIALRESEQRYRQLFDASPDAIFMASDTGQILDANQTAITRYGYSLEEFQNLSVVALAVPDLAEFVPLRFQEALDRSLRFEWRHRRKDGRDFPVEIAAEPIALGEQRVVLASIRDITERKQAEAQLHESERRFTTLFRVCPVGMCITRLADGVFFDVNEAFAKILGYAPEELLGRSSLELSYWLAPEDRVRLVQALLENGSVRDWEVDFRRKDGSVGHSLRSLERLALDGEDCILTALNDITERKRAEVALRKSEEMLEIVLDSIPQGVFWKDRKSVYLGANRVSRQAMGLTEEQSAAGLNDFDLTSLSREQAEFFVRKDSEVMNSNQPQYGFEESMTLPDGSIIWLETNKIPMHDSTGVVSGILGTWSNITERKNANIELAASRKRLELMSRRWIAAQESERRHLALELHDEIGQALTGIKLNLKALQQPALTPKSSSLVEDTIAVVDQTLQQVRSLALDLRPSMLDDIGLVAALRWCLDRQSQRAGLIPQFVADSSVSGVSPEINTACFRVAQESLTNVGRHAKARHVRVELRQDDQELELLVRDDGIGFDVTTARNRNAHGESLGLLGMQERVQLVGGQIEIVSATSQGTTIRVRIPIPTMTNDKTPNDESKPIDE